MDVGNGNSCIMHPMWSQNSEIIKTKVASAYIKYSLKAEEWKFIPLEVIIILGSLRFLVETMHSKITVESTPKESFELLFKE